MLIRARITKFFILKWIGYRKILYASIPIGVAATIVNPQFHSQVILHLCSNRLFKLTQRNLKPNNIS